MAEYSNNIPTIVSLSALISIGELFGLKKDANNLELALICPQHLEQHAVIGIMESPIIFHDSFCLQSSVDNCQVPIFTVYGGSCVLVSHCRWSPPVATGAVCHRMHVAGARVTCHQAGAAPGPHYSLLTGKTNLTSSRSCLLHLCQTCNQCLTRPRLFRFTHTMASFVWILIIQSIVKSSLKYSKKERPR